MNGLSGPLGYRGYLSQLLRNEVAPRGASTGWSAFAPLPFWCKSPAYTHFFGMAAMTQASESISTPLKVAPSKPGWGTRVSTFTTRVLLFLAGVGLLIGFFLPWVSLEAVQLSGFNLVVTSGRAVDALAGPNSGLLILIPVLALSLIASTVFLPRVAVWVGMATGTTIILYGVYTLMRAFLGTTGAGMWITVVGSLLALTVGLVGFGRSTR